ncbi:prepilin peptidase [Microbacterium sp. NPDC055683]
MQPLVAAVLYPGFLGVGAWLIWIDIQEHRLPNRIVLPAVGALVVVLAAAAFAAGEVLPFWRALAGGIALGAFYALLRAVQPHGLGGGDVKLSLLVGVFLGWHGWTPLVVGGAAAFLLGGAWAVVLLAARRADPATAIAFGPWMVVGAWAGLLAA